MAEQLLLDTHAFIWWREDNVRLNGSARQRVGTAAVVFISVASAWEAAIKVALGKLKLPESFEAGVEAAGFEKLQITFGHAEAVGMLARHHSDPFDRMLLTQALCERLTIVTHDRRFAPYGVDVLWT